jgi:hypothetical protein
LRFSKRTYRALSHSFSIRSNSRVALDHADWVLGNFAVPLEPQLSDFLPGQSPPPVYTLVSMGRGAGTHFDLLCDQTKLISGVDRQDSLLRLFGHINLETLRRTGDFVLVHSGAVATPGGEGVILPASSGSGKSTLVLGLVMAGYQYLSDEAAAIDPVSRKLFPFPKAVSIKDGSIELFNGLRKRVGSSFVSGEMYLPAEEIRRGAAGGPCPIHYVVFPKYQRDADTELVPLSAAEATLEIMMNLLNRHFYGGRALTVLADIARNASCFRLTTGDLGAAIEAVQTVTGAVPTGPNGRSAASDVGHLRSAGDRA